MKATRIIARIIGFPFFVLLAAYATMILFLKYVKNYVIYGGEAIAYTNNSQPLMIQNVFDKLVEIQNQINKPIITPES